MSARKNGENATCPTSLKSNRKELESVSVAPFSLLGKGKNAQCSKETNLKRLPVNDEVFLNLTSCKTVYLCEKNNPATFHKTWTIYENAKTKSPLFLEENGVGMTKRTFNEIIMTTTGYPSIPFKLKIIIFHYVLSKEHTLSFSLFILRYQFLQ